MFRIRQDPTRKTPALAIIGLLVLSLSALGVSAWIMVDFQREQIIVQELIKNLPPNMTASAEELMGELRWQFRLTILIVINVILTALAVVILWRAYRSSLESLRDIKAQASDILSSMDQAVITTDMQGEITSINERGRQFLQLEDDGIGHRLNEASSQIALEEYRQEMQLPESIEETRDFTLMLEGTLRTLRGFCQPMKNREFQVIGHIIQLRDVTERVLIDERLRRMERYMGLGNLAAGLHHEIKNPLAALSLHVQLLEEQLDQSDASDDIQEMLGVIKTEVMRVGGVLENFRDFASVGHLHYDDVEVQELLDRQLKLIRPQAEQQGVTLKTEFSTEPIPTVEMDRIRLEQVLLNLLLNAIEAMPEGGTISVEVTRMTEPDSVRIEISDTGSGIPVDLQDRIFDPYFTTKSQGTGMGLALCEKIIRQHNGALDFRSSPRGTTFRISLPLKMNHLETTRTEYD
ncbi:Sensor protein ZraS [Polystyrenella longa]|uniref:histidine kinase n=1 Tax=Polystyrenella longa TaxID=2528007 RepID=A0A518CSJ2_9PLAN|nr:ATP-binding protein [Polystyrenella longa]QDU82186.1 Sensor protein ZraS [Polystyrenella longa]